MSTINDRIDEIISEKKLTNKEFGDFLKVTEATVRNLRSDGVVKPGYIELISKSFHINKQWLIDGIGEKYTSAGLNLENLDLDQLAQVAIDKWDNLMKHDKFKSRYYLQLTRTLNMDIDEIFEKVLKK